jgi:hypothetical protein
LFGVFCAAAPLQPTDWNWKKLTAEACDVAGGRCESNHGKRISSDTAYELTVPQPPDDVKVSTSEVFGLVVCVNSGMIDGDTERML